jgi:predicted ATPase/predicted negative regulator of RcsB-dependent stress response/DNA-binding XRE family transcriptional regulator
MLDSVSAVSPASFLNFGDLLRYLRKRAELSQRELALHVGYHYSYMSRIENNEYIPDSAMLMARFVPALGLEKEPAWTRRLLELGTAGEKSPAPRTGNKPASVEPITDSATTDHDILPGLFPVSLTPLLGRHQEVMALVQSLSGSDVRLITLIGPPGVGKTRLAIQAATEAAGMFAHGLKFIDLAPISEPNGFLPTLAQHLDVNEIPEMPLITRMAQALRQKNILLVLDNFEQIIGAAPQVYQLLSNTSNVKTMVTSRVPLHIVGENQFSVPPLPLPLFGEPSMERSRSGETVQELMEFAAIRLFVERARAVQPEFQLTPENTGAVLEICRRLDGLPLAIELAAARVRTLSPLAMLKEFEHRFDWLAPNHREEQSSKQTLRGAIEWSYNLLSEKEQILLRRLSVFSARRTVETAKAVCAAPEAASRESALQADEIFDLLVQLTDKSLLFTEPQNEETRFNFLETIHEFAREKLKQAGEEVTMRNRHLAYFCQMAEQFEIEIERENQTIWLNRCEAEHNNMRAALDWSLKDGADLQTGNRLAASLGLFWYLHSHFVEGLERIKIFLQKARDLGDERILAKLLFRTADLHLHRAEFNSAVRLGDEAVALSKKINDKPLLAWALYVQGDIYLAIHDLTAAQKSLTESVEVCIEISYAAVQDISLLLLSTILLRQGELDRAHTTVLEGLALAEQLSDPWGIASGLGTLGEILLKQKKYEEARMNFERSLEASRIVGDKIIIGSALVNLAVLTNLQEQFEESDHYAEDALGIFQLVGDETQQPFPLRIMGYAAVHAGNLVRARVLMRESLIGNVSLQNLRGQLACLVGMAQCSLAEEGLQEAVMLCALAHNYRQEKNLKLHETDELAFESVLKHCKKKLGKARYESSYKQGQSLKLEDTLLQLMKE